MTTAREQFQAFYQAVHATDLLSPREKMFIGLAVTLHGPANPEATRASRGRGKRACHRRPWMRW
jgi:hypothetical protein